MSKKASALVLTGLMVINQISDTTVIYASESIQPANNQQQSDTQTKQVVYLMNGEGDLKGGDGTKERPYQNIRTALEQVVDGGVIKLIGTVQYNKHDIDTDTNSALPLMITKNVTFEGASNNSKNDGIVSRAPIQLGANVTFKDIRIQLVNSNELMPGVPSPAPTPADEGIFKSGRTIYTAGYTLTLDNVNTRIGTNAEQTTYRPFISGGTYKNQGTIGQKSIVNIKNVNDETRFRTIYAGDYWLERNHAFELNLDSTIHSRLILDQTIHTGGIILPYKGDVTINVAGDATYLTLDHTKHLGNVDVNASGKALLSEMKYNQVRNLTLSDDAYIEMKSGMTFEVENLSIKDDALLDFRKMETNPKVRGSFTGSTASTADTTKTAGAIALNQNQTLEIQGEASGVTRLNNHERIPGQLVKLAHPYITAAKDSTAEFLIEAVENDPERKVVQSINDQNRAAWVVTNNISQNFKTFQWNGGDEQLVDPEGYDEFVYPIQYINDQGQAYLPEDSSDFTLTLIKDGKVVTKEDVDEFIELDFDFYIDLDGAAVLTFQEDNKYKGDIELQLTHTSGQIIKKTITILRNASALTGDVAIEGTPKVGQTLSAKTNLSNDAENLKYKWLANGKEILGETKSTFELQKQHAGQKIKVQISASNYVGTLSSTEVTVPELNHQRPTLQGLSEVIIRQGKTFDLTSGVSATDEDGQDITAQIQFPTVDFAQLPVGRHELEYSVTDKNGLTSSIKRILIVESNQAPVIQGLAPVTLKMNEVDQFKKLDKVLVTDDHDQNLIPTVTGTIVAPQPGQVLTSKLIYTVKDNDGNITTSERLITVTNHLPKVQANSIMIKAGEAIDLLKDTRINLLATDIEDGNLLDRIQVTNESGLNTSNPVEGKYPVTYTVTDVDGNTVYATIMINVQSNQSPILHGVTAITLKLGEVNQFNPLDGVTVEDDHNQNLNPTVTGIIDKPKAGQSLTSTLTYTVIDNEGNQTTLDRLITVTNYLPVLQVTPITIKANQAIDLLKDSRLNLLATDIEDGDLTEQITVKNSGGLDVNKPVEGEYVVTYTVTDSDGNTTEQTVNIKVQSNHAPTISGANDQTIISGEEFDLLAGVEAFDVEDGKLSNIQVTGTINPHQIGEQSISYQVTDKDGNVTTVNRFITVIYQTETPSDSTISETLIPHTQTQLNQLIEDIKAYDNQATVVEVKEDPNYYRYKIKLSLNLTTYSISTTNLSEYVIEIKVAKSIQHEVGLPALKPEENNNSEIKPEEKPEDNNNSEIKPEEKPEDNNNSETKPEEKPEDNNNSETKPEEKPVTGYSNLMGYLGGGMIALGGIVSFKKKKK